MKWEEEKHPRDNAGRFTDGYNEEPNLPSARRIVEKYERNFGKINGINIPKQDYAVIRKQAFEKYGDKKTTAGGYTSNHYIAFHYLGDGEIVPFIRVPIEGNEVLVNYLEVKIKNDKTDE